MATTISEDLGVISYEELAGRFRPVFERIAAGAVEREQERALAHDAVGWLRDAGFGGVRIPVAYGGSGASLTQLFRLLIELAEADSNLTQILRAHFWFAEERLHEPASTRRDLWLRRIADGAIVGNAATEVGDAALGAVQTVVSGEGDTWHATGTKHYSTGSLYADWVAVLVRRAEDVGFALIPTDEEGPTLVDDWRGFGQRLTASGTTLLEAVAVDPENVFWANDQVSSYQFAFNQLNHLASLSGIARAVVRDAAAYVRDRRRVFSHGSGDRAADDPLVQSVVGRLSALAFAAESTTLAAAGYLEAVNLLRPHGHVPDAAFDEAEIAVSKAQVVVAELVLRATTMLFETGGASTVYESRQLDRHWRNARVLTVHNPVIYKERVIGDHVLNDTSPARSWNVGTKG
jgi:alkylation response protein AidB-like acyl-CoA dehydrogenase